jgi:predicted AAA+ superfamily ATPase
VVRRYRLREIDKINVLAKYYVTNTASPTTFNSIRKFLGIPIETVGRFSTYLEAAYLVFFVKRFSHSMKEQEKSPRKVYAIDTGLRNAVSLRFQSDIGKLVETIVFLELLRRGLDISYWKDKEQHEVDFVIREGISPTELIQVCWNLEDPKTKKRELAALVRAAKDLKLKSGTIITNETEGNEVKDGITIRYIPFLAFMLGSQNFISN